MMLTISQLTLCRPPVEILTKLDLSLAGGTTMVITGANGSGKTTLLRAIAGLLPKTHGRIHIGNQSIEKDPIAYKASLVYLGHDDGLAGGLTACENIIFWASARGMAIEPVSIKKAFQSLGIESLMPLETRHLSQGERQRVNLVRIAYDHIFNLEHKASPSLWLLDEPTASLDEGAITLLTNLINAHVNNKGAAVVTTHSKLNLKNAQHLKLKKPLEQGS